MSAKQNKPFHQSVMLIDDNEIDNFINEKMIKAFSFSENIFVHTSAKSALEYLKNISILPNAANNLIPSYIFLDINMPILDGFHFLDDFEALPNELKSKIKIVMLTTSLNPSDIEKSKSYKNVKGFLNKPLTEKDLDKLK